MARILISGSEGLIGGAVATALVDQGHNVIGIDDLSAGLRNGPKGPNAVHRYQFHKIDIANYRQVEEIFMGTRPEIIFHAAACPREGSSEFQPVYITRTNLYITSILIELGIRYGMKRFVFTSSMSVFGRGNGKDSKPPFDERMPANPVDPYGVNKWACEKIIRQLCDTHQRDAIVIRPHNVIGEGQSLHDIKRNVAAIFMNSIMRGEPLYLFGGGQCKRAFSYILDSLPCFVKACFDPKVIKETICVGGKEAITVRELADAIIEDMAELGYKRPELIDLPLRPHEVTDAYCSTKKSEDLLDYKETYGWREGIKRMCAWAHEKGPQEWLYDDLPLANDKTPKHWVKP